MKLNTVTLRVFWAYFFLYMAMSAVGTWIKFDEPVTRPLGQEIILWDMAMITVSALFAGGTLLTTLLGICVGHAIDGSNGSTGADSASTGYTGKLAGATIGSTAVPLVLFISPGLAAAHAFLSFVLLIDVCGSPATDSEQSAAKK